MAIIILGILQVYRMPSDLSHDDTVSKYNIGVGSSLNKIYK